MRAAALRVPFPRFGAGIGLHRVAAIAERLGIDLAALGARACVITGSNGKGSTAAMTAAMLAAARGKVGRFTSPHLLSIHERFAIDGVDIADEELRTHWAAVEMAARRYEAAHQGDSVGGFEFLFLLAARWFAARDCAFTVWEAGIGGRYDPTRLLQARVAALASIDLEHTELLGATRELIAYDKLDVCAPGGVTFLGESLTPLLPRLETYAALRDVRLEPIAWREDGAAIVVGDVRVTPPLAGAHQRNNAALAVRLGETMLGDAAPAAFAAGMRATRWPGRLETLPDGIVIDVGHTPAAIAAAKSGYLAQHEPGVLVCGVSSDKAAADLLAALAPGFPVIIAAAAEHKGRPPEALAPLLRAAAPGAELMLATGAREARALALARGGGVYVAGSLFLAAEFRALAMGVDPKALYFF